MQVLLQILLKKAGSWYSYGEHRLGQGRENSKEFLKENPEICLEIENKIRKKIWSNKR